MCWGKTFPCHLWENISFVSWTNQCFGMQYCIIHLDSLKTYPNSISDIFFDRLIQYGRSHTLHLPTKVWYFTSEVAEVHGSVVTQIIGGDYNKEIIIMSNTIRDDRPEKSVQIPLLRCSNDCHSILANWKLEIISTMIILRDDYLIVGHEILPGPQDEISVRGSPAKDPFAQTKH